MPKHKKHKPTEHELKLQKAHHRNEYLKQLKHMCDKVVGKAVFEKIPHQTLLEIYNVRCQPARVQAGTGYTFSTRYLKDTQKWIYILLKHTKIQLPLQGGFEISLYGFMTYALTLILYAGRLKESDYTAAAEVKKALTPLLILGDSEIYANAWKSYGGIMNTFCLIESDYTKQIIALKHRNAKPEDGVSGFISFIDVYAPKPVIQNINYQRIAREAYPVCWFFAEPALAMQEVEIDSGLFKQKEAKKMPVFIQTHALKRLQQRMDGIVPGILHFAVFESLKEPKVLKNRQGEWLIEYRLFAKKAGYFRADMAEGKLLLRTFLFLTNNGTPEGEKLHDNMGINKKDKIYLSIDKLSTFLNSDIASNKRVNDMFVEAGCQSLFEIDKNLYLPLDSNRPAERQTADWIAHYLGLDVDKLGQDEPLA